MHVDLSAGGAEGLGTEGHERKQLSHPRLMYSRIRHILLSVFLDFPSSRGPKCGPSLRVLLVWTLLRSAVMQSVFGSQTWPQAFGVAW